MFALRRLTWKNFLSSKSKSIINNLAFFSLNQVGLNNAEQPFDYTKRNYNLFWKFFYSSLCNIGDNTLCISIESNHGVNRGRLAKELAAHIDFLYVPPPDLMRMYRYDPERGIDMMSVWNECARIDRKFPTLEDWLLDPSLGHTIQYQFAMLKTRMYQYRMSQIHMLSTGQGVLLDRCYWSDTVIANALHQCGYLSDDALACLNEYHELYDYELKRPHLIIYIDKPVEECLKTIQDEGSEAEKKSCLFADTKYLAAVERQYKEKFLPSMSENTPFLTYSWNEVDPQMIAEDMERVDFTDDSKFDDWKVLNSGDMDNYRLKLSSDRYWNRLARRLRKHYLVDELTLLGEEKLHMQSLLNEHPALKWDKGFDPTKDKFLFLKLFRLRNPFKLERKPFL